ncbi:UNVERIFIED_CONTAM: hypothetical protein B566_EDAN019347 [Ephemera danica]|nr:hypothetical protein B566_EDAN019347 [Ephemera danica]
MSPMMVLTSRPPEDEVSQSSLELAFSPAASFATLFKILAKSWPTSWVDSLATLLRILAKFWVTPVLAKSSSEELASDHSLNLPKVRKGFST